MIDATISDALVRIATQAHEKEQALLALVALFAAKAGWGAGYMLHNGRQSIAVWDGALNGWRVIHSQRWEWEGTRGRLVMQWGDQ